MSDASLWIKILYIWSVSEVFEPELRGTSIITNWTYRRLPNIPTIEQSEIYSGVSNITHFLVFRTQMRKKQCPWNTEHTYITKRYLEPQGLQIRKRKLKWWKFCCWPSLCLDCRTYITNLLVKSEERFAGKKRGIRLAPNGRMTVTSCLSQDEIVCIYKAHMYSLQQNHKRRVIFSISELCCVK